MSNLKDIVEANESFKRNREGLHSDIIGFSEELLSYFPNAVFTSGKRPGAVTNFGKPSRHSKGEAVDLRITPEIGEFLSNNRKGIELLYKYQLGFLDESKAENKKWGNALHIGKDTALVERTNSKWNKWQNRQEGDTSEYVSNGVINFQKQPSMTGVNLGELVPEEDKTKEQKEIEESNKALELEDRKLKLFEQFNSRQQPQQEEEVAQQTVQTPDFNALETYQQIDQFVSNPIMQRGGVVNDNLRNNISNRDYTKDLEYERKRRIEQQQALQDYFSGKTSYVESPTLTQDKRTVEQRHQDQIKAQQAINTLNKKGGQEAVDKAKQIEQQIGDFTSEVLSTPQKVATLLTTGEYGTPSEVMGMPGLGGMAVDMVFDPLGVGLVGKLSKADKVIDATKAGNKVLNKTDDAVKIATSSIDDVNKSVKPAWQMQELPGLHLKSTMEGEAISKIVEPKTGLVNTEQALAIIAKESGGADKVALIRQGLGNNIPKKMDYNEFKKTVQDQLIPLETKINPMGRSEYGLQHIGYDDAPPMDMGALTFSNKSKFGRGSSAHGNPEETLGHAHFLRDAESPDVLTVTQIQSDAFQGSHRIMPNKTGATPERDKWKKMLTPEGRKELVEIGGEEAADLAQQSAKEFLEKAKKETMDILGANPIQKQLLDKNHQERYLQELVDYAGKRGDVNKVRVPTSETAAKVQGYRKSTINDNSLLTSKELDELKSLSEKYSKMPNNVSDDLYDDVYNPIRKRLDEINKKRRKETNYSPEHQTILKKYSGQPKTIKKLFGVEPKVVTDSKGNTWYEFDIPKKFKEGKGEIKAFGIGTIGTGAMMDNKENSTPQNSFALGGEISINELTQFNEGGQIPTSSLGQWLYPNQVVNVPTDGSITMQGIDYPLLGISQETGQRQMMFPGLEYFFKNTQNVVEVPLDFLHPQ